jgi:hypothetical protein
MTEEVMTARDELNELATILRKADAAEKKAKAQKDKVRGPFFDLISELVRDEIPLARKTVTVQVDPSQFFDQDKWLAFHYPEWNIVAVQPENDGEGPATRYVITLEESDQFKKYEFVHGGFKYGRTVKMTGKDFNAEALFKDAHSPKFPEGVRTRLQNLVEEKQITTYTVDEDQALALMAELPETVAILQEYWFPGTPSLALLPIKAVKETE